jgi:hypothetical protein
VKFIIIQFSPWSVFLPFRSKYLPQHFVLKNPQTASLPMWYILPKSISRTKVR